jgi:predicted nucleic acid-binding protein
MPDRALIDTSAILAVVNPNDQYHERAVTIGRRVLAGGGRWVGTTLVLAELHGLVLQRRDPSTARSILARLLGDPAYEWLDATAELAREAKTRWLDRFGDQRFSLTNAVSFEVMRRLRLSRAFAFDHHFVVAGFAPLE